MAHSPWLSLFLIPTLAVFAAEGDPAIPVKADQPQPVETIANTPANTPANPPGPATTIKEPDPTAAIVAEGKYIYRQRDVDALVQIASRHAKARFSNAEEMVLRQAIISMLIAREPLDDALSQLPVSFTSAARDMFVLDILDYEAELSKAATSTPADQSTTETPAANGSTSPAVANNIDNAQGSLLLRLPPLHLSRTLPALGKRHLSITIALFFRSREQADKLENQAPLVQDAILSYIQGLPPAQFAEPNQITLKDGITAAIIAKVPAFPPDAVLIPEMDTAAPMVEKKADATK